MKLTKIAIGGLMVLVSTSCFALSDATTLSAMANAAAQESRDTSQGAQIADTATRSHSNKQRQASRANRAANVVLVRAATINSKPNTKGTVEASMQLINKTNNQYRLVAVRTPLAKKTVMAQPVRSSGRMVMRATRNFDVTGNNLRQAAKTDLHVYMYGFKGQLRKGRRVPLTLVYSDGSQRVIQARVR